MKIKFLSLMFFAVAVAGCAVFGGGREQKEAQSEGGAVYEGTAQGYRGPISLQVRLSGGSITEIIIIESEEDFSVGEAAMEELIDLVILCNSTDVDAVSGATESSRGFLQAVDNAIMKR
jgi:urocanate reductase